MSVRTNATVTVTKATDVRVTRVHYTSEPIYRVVFGGLNGPAVRFTAEAAAAMVRALGGELALDEAEAREAALPPIPDPPESLADRLTTEHLHDVAEGREP